MIDNLTYREISKNTLAANTTLNFALFESSLPDNKTSALWNDPIYGFNDYRNFHRWGALNNGSYGVKAIIMETEMKLYFGLSDM